VQVRVGVEGGTHGCQLGEGVDELNLVVCITKKVTAVAVSMIIESKNILVTSRSLPACGMLLPWFESVKKGGAGAAAAAAAAAVSTVTTRHCLYTKMTTCVVIPAAATAAVSVLAKLGEGVDEVNRVV
jgi:hypothetical protein